MPPLFPLALAAIGIGVAARFARGEWQRVNRELDSTRARGRESLKTLRKDPRHGDWRVR